MPSAAEIRALFPAATSAPYLGTNGYGLMPTPTRDVLVASVGALHDQGYGAHHRLERGVDHVREAVATLIGATAEEVAFTRNTADGLGIVADAFPWHQGDEVLVFGDEYGTVLYPFLGAAQRGGPRVRVADLPAGGVVTATSLAAALGPSTRAVIVSWVRFDTGGRVDLSELGQVCAARGVWLVVDAIQGLGLFPLDVRECGVAALAAGTHKWLCGLAGLGVLYVRRDLLTQLRPVRTGLGAIVADRHAEPPTLDSFVLRSELARLEDGASNELAIAALGASLDVLASVDDGVEHVRHVGEHLADRWRAADGIVVAPRNGGSWSGIVALRPPPSLDVDAVLGRAWQRRIVIGAQRGNLVPSVHIYTSTDDADAFVDVLSD